MGNPNGQLWELLQKFCGWNTAKFSWLDFVQPASINSALAS